MKFRARFLATAASFFVLLPACGLTSKAGEADMIVTAAPVYQPLAALSGAERFPKGAQLLLLHEGNAEPLVVGFAATADANVSFDGRTVLFAGKQAATDPWQIWELTLSTHAVRKVISTETDAIRPLYLPGLLPEGRLVYAHRTLQGFQLETARTREGPPSYASVDPTPAVVQITYLPASMLPVDVLADGRILFEAGFPLASKTESRPVPELFLVYSDGSGVESYRCDHGLARWGGKQVANGDVVFTHGTSLARFTSPLAHEAHIAAPHAEYAGGIAETASGEWLVSARTAPGTHYALKLWKPGSPALASLHAESGKDIVQPVLVGPRTRPNRHPSGLHNWSYANLLALDARQSRGGDLKTAPASVRLDTQDTRGHAVVTGTSAVDSDGSFFVKVPGDKPIRFALLDAKGAVVRQEHGWFWIRQGEQRICVGCHTGPERASENRVPAVLMRTTTPADLTGVNPAEAAEQKALESPRTGLSSRGSSRGGN
jgi:hypothetical protein